ncbi:MAG: hypothetical protein ACP5H7_02575 [Minisyncoccia bacterium]
MNKLNKRDKEKILKALSGKKSLSMLEISHLASKISSEKDREEFINLMLGLKKMSIREIYQILERNSK